MQVINKIELKLENFDKCNILCDNDCPLGVLYDYSCALQVFVLERMEAAKKSQAAVAETEPVPAAEPDIKPE